MKFINIVLTSLITLSFSQKNVAQNAQDNYTAKYTSFRLLAPDTVKNVKLRIYKDASSATPWKTIRMRHTAKETFTAKVTGDLKGKFYTFDIGKGETPGIFATAVGVNGKRAAIINIRETNPEGWNEDRHMESGIKNPCDLIIYELHHRDFSIDSSSGLKYKGKYLALTEPKAINHLRKLGINAVHILPSFDFATIDETRLDVPQYNWGYDPLNYNVPEGSYSTDPYNPVVRINEFKQMVLALHKAGIKVILDVVYNHTNNIDGSNFQLTYPDYYYRKAGNKYSDGSGCGNETASEKPHMRNYMLQSMLFWAQEYHIDGFRIDLMGVHDIETINYIKRSFEALGMGDKFIYGEGWSAGTCAYPAELLATKANIGQMNGIAAFCDDMRDALRGPFNDDTKGAFLAAIPGAEESIKFGIAGAIEHPQVNVSKVNYSDKFWACEPNQMISYVSCHDDMCLTDRLQASIPGISDDEMIRLDLLAQTVVLTSQGVPFILCGEEMLRNKKGVHNSYNSPDSINHLDWFGLEKHPEVFDYYSKLISLRKNHPAFRLGSAEKVRRHLDFLPSADNFVAFRLKDNAGGDAWRNIIVAFNSAKQPKKVTVPEGDYVVICRGTTIDEHGIDKVSGSEVTVPAQSALIIHD